MTNTEQKSTTTTKINDWRKQAINELARRQRRERKREEERRARARFLAD